MVGEGVAVAFADFVLFEATVALYDGGRLVDVDNAEVDKLEEREEVDETDVVEDELELGMPVLDVGTTKLMIEMDLGM